MKPKKLLKLWVLYTACVRVFLLLLTIGRSHVYTATPVASRHHWGEALLQLKLVTAGHYFQSKHARKLPPKGKILLHVIIPVLSPPFTKLTLSSTTHKSLFTGFVFSAVKHRRDCSQTNGIVAWNQISLMEPKSLENHVQLPQPA